MFDKYIKIDTVLRDNVSITFVYCVYIGLIFKMYIQNKQSHSYTLDVDGSPGYVLEAGRSPVYVLEVDCTSGHV